MLHGVWKYFKDLNPTPLPFTPESLTPQTPLTPLNFEIFTMSSNSVSHGLCFKMLKFLGSSLQKLLAIPWPISVSVLRLSYSLLQTETL